MKLAAVLAVATVCAAVAIASRKPRDPFATFEITEEELSRLTIHRLCG